MRQGRYIQTGSKMGLICIIENFMDFVITYKMDCEPIRELNTEMLSMKGEHGD